MSHLGAGGNRMYGEVSGMEGDEGGSAAVHSTLHLLSLLFSDSISTELKSLFDTQEFLFGLKLQSPLETAGPFCQSQ